MQRIPVMKETNEWKSELTQLDGGRGGGVVDVVVDVGLRWGDVNERQWRYPKMQQMTSPRSLQ